MRQMRLTLLFTILAAALGPAACDRVAWEPEPKYGCPETQLPPRNSDAVSIDQGIWGDVWFWEGDFMPMCPSGTVTPVVREVLIHELTSLDQVDQSWPPMFYTAVHTELIAATWSDSTGFFEIALPPGEYSVFVREDSLYFANGYDGYGHIMPREVTEGQVSDVLISIDYLATW